ncbi:MAG: hypothetical protein ABI068_15260, partial [Ktedonobacterales bacterium]
METSHRRAPGAGAAPRWRRHASLTLWAVSLALCVSLAVLLAEATGALAWLPGTPLQAQIAQAANPTNEPGGPNAATPTAIPPTATPPPATPTLSMLSPTSKEGPVGAHITLGGSHWGASATVTVTAISSGPCEGSTPLQTLTTAQSSGSGAINIAFIWPSSLGSVGTTYIICASNGTASAAGIPYTVLSASPPTISLSVSTVQVGGVVSISGSNFTGTQHVVLSSETTSNVKQKIRTVAVAGDGSFLTQFTPTAADAGPLNIMAATSAQNGATPALQASAQLTVQAPTTPTVTTTAAPTTTTAASGGNGQHNNTSGPSLGLIIVLVVAILLVLLLIVGLIVLVAMRRRGGAGPQGPNGGYGNYGDYGDYGPAGGQGGYGATGRTPTPGYGATGRQNVYGQTGRYGALGQGDQFGRAGVYNNQGSQGDPYAPTVQNYVDPAVGGVAQWDNAEADPEPDPNWQPRPMSGGRRYAQDFDDSARDDGFAYPDLPPIPGQTPDLDAPNDPWGSASGGFIPGGSYRPPVNTPDTAGAEPPIYGGMAPRNSDRYGA